MCLQQVSGQRKCLEKLPESIVACRPMRDGVIANFELPGGSALLDDVGAEGAGNYIANALEVRHESPP